MVAVVNFPIVDLQSDDEARHRRDLASAVNSLRKGKINTALNVTLRTGQETTTVDFADISAVSRIVVTPGDEAAAAELASGTIFITSNTITSGQFVVQHTIYSKPRTLRIEVLS